MQKINHSFVCEYCGKLVKPHPSSSRNHCPYCLYSKHLDLNLPGDRASICYGLMEPLSLKYSGKKQYSLVHSCLKCGIKKNNVLAEDDNWEEIIKISQTVLDKL